MTTMRVDAPAKRASPGSDGGNKQKAVIIVVSVAAVLLFAVIFFFILRSLRIPKHIRASEQGRNKRQTWLQRLRGAIPAPRGKQSRRSTTQAHSMSRDPEAAVDRHTSIRSVATLPAYSAVPRDGEGVIGREGDREGMDTVIEFPETVDEEEGRREQEMQSLWRIRQTRRQEAAEREERRRRRREARARGDNATLIALRHESMLRSTLQQSNGSNAMIAEHHSRPRDRRVSAVSYGDLGVARHDGSRVRANSNESDSRPLLDSAAGAGMAGPARPWMSRESFSTHHRMTSNTSIQSMSSVDSDERPSYSRGGSDMDAISLQQTRSRAQSIPLSLRTASGQLPASDSDLGDSRIPLPDPPQYDSMGFEDAPPYEHPEDSATTLQAAEQGVADSPPQLPTIDRLPSIRITESSPIDPPRLTRLPPTNAPTIHEETN